MLKYSVEVDDVKLLCDTERNLSTPKHTDFYLVLHMSLKYELLI